MWRASDWKALAGRCIWQGERVFYATGRALTDIPHSAGDARHHCNSYTRPYTNSGSTERYGNGGRFSAVVPGYAAVGPCFARHAAACHHHRPSVSWSLTRPEAAQQAALVHHSLCLGRRWLRIAGLSLSRRVSPSATSRMHFFPPWKIV